MSIEYLECKSCGKVESGCYMKHLPSGSYCEACYKKLPKKEKEEFFEPNHGGSWTLKNHPAFKRTD